MERERENARSQRWAEGVRTHRLITVKEREPNFSCPASIPTAVAMATHMHIATQTETDMQAAITRIQV